MMGIAAGYIGILPWSDDWWDFVPHMGEKRWSDIVLMQPVDPRKNS
jgi:hypothetical protein